MLLLAFAIVPLERPDGEWPNVTTRFNGKPMLTAGLAFAPRAIASLLASARAKSIAR